MWLQILQLPDAEGPKEFSYDEEWLATLRSTHSLMSLQRRPVSLPGQLLPTLNDAPGKIPHCGALICHQASRPATPCPTLRKFPYMAGLHCHRQP